MRVTINFPAYNPKCFSKPWIALVTRWPVGGKPEIQWGKFIGSAETGGEVEIEAEAGAIIRFGQKDFKSKHSYSKWGQVVAGGCWSSLTALEARWHWEKTNSALKPVLAVHPVGVSRAAPSGAEVIDNVLAAFKALTTGEQRAAFLVEVLTALPEDEFNQIRVEACDVRLARIEAEVAAGATVKEANERLVRIEATPEGVGK